MRATGRAACHRRERLVEGWEVCSVDAGRIADPSQLNELPGASWVREARLGTAAAVLRDAGQWSLDDPPRRFDAPDWWYRLRFDAPPAGPHEAVVLGFDGLATACDAWLNGEPLLASDNMFIAHEQPVSSRLRHGRNELALRFKSLDALLQARRPRPRWRAPMIENQQLRWHRTTVLGRTPGWSPSAAPVGPWRDIWIERRQLVEVHDLRVQCGLRDPSTGVVDVLCRMTALGPDPISTVTLELQHGGDTWRCALHAAGQARYGGQLLVPDVRRWWPHTHGEPCLYDAQLTVSLGGSGETTIDAGRLGFRTIETDMSGGRFAVRVNGIAVFCRGACWTPMDAVSLRSPAQDCAAAVEQVRQAGMNMLRIAGTMVYEDHAFHAACDEAGILVWQDFMFANMDYPQDDAAFVACVRTEVEQHARRLEAHASTAVLCGNSEVEQQAAMWGATRESWSPALFRTAIPSWLRELDCRLPYWPSSAHGGAFPFQADQGTTSYYGVGAYLRPIEDARRAALSFATECLAFANVPDDTTIARMPNGASLRVHHPQWKTRTPRDLGAGWDFEDVRDHYLQRLFSVDPAGLRHSDHERYLALSRVVTAEVMAASFTEWRRADSGCAGALVWFLRDLQPGAGWGLLDDTGRPKPCFHALARALQPVWIGITDEGGNGLCLHLSNDTAQHLACKVVLTAYNDMHALVSHAERPVELPAHAALSVPVAGLFDQFIDLAAAYRFGPAPATLVAAQLLDANQTTLGEAFHFPAGRQAQRQADVGLSAVVTAVREDAIELTVHAERFADSVHIDLPGHAASDNHFHLAPRTTRTILLHRQATGGARRGSVQALNAHQVVHFDPEQ